MWTPWDEANLVRQAIVEPQYRPQALARLAQMDSAEWPPLRDCFAEMLRVTLGDTSGTRRAIQRLRAFAALDPPPIPRDQWEPLEFRVCPLLLETLLKGSHDRLAGGPASMPSTPSCGEALAGSRSGRRPPQSWRPTGPLPGSARPRETSRAPLRPSGAGRTIGIPRIYGPCPRSCVRRAGSRLWPATPPRRGGRFDRYLTLPDRLRSGLRIPTRFRGKRARGARVAVRDHASEHPRD